MNEENTIESVIHGMKADYVCSECGNKQSINILPYINFAENPEYYALVKGLDIFRVKCEKCGATKIVQFDTLIVDDVHKYFLYLLSDRSLHNKFKYQITYFIETTLNKDGKYDLQKYNTRLVFAPNDLVEKMNIFEIGLDDEAIELIKKGIYDKKIVNEESYDLLYFDGLKEADLEFVAFSSKTTNLAARKIVIAHEFYNKVVDSLKNFKLRHREYFEVIDSDWVASTFEKPQEE